MASFDLGIRAGHLLTMKNGHGDVHQDFFIGVKDGVIIEVSACGDARAATLAKECIRFIDRQNQIVLPGLINGHTHLPMSLFRGFEDDRPFHEWLFQRILPAELALVDADFVRTGVELSALECLRFGTTTVNDMYYYVETIAQVIHEVGMRAIIAWPFMDFVAPDERHLGEQAVASRDARFQKFHELYRNHPRIRPALGPHAPYTCCDETIQEVTRLSKKYSCPVHMHVCETRGEVQESMEKFGKTPVQRLHDLGALHSRFIAAHAVHTTDAEIELLVKSGVSVIYNPDSNMKLSSGVAPIPKYRKAGVPVGLGTDGAASNNNLSMFSAMDLGTKLQKVSNQSNTAMVALDALNLATHEGAKALGLDHLIGSIEVGKRADLISLRTDLPHVQPLYSVLSQLVYAYQGLEVDTVVCDGKVLLENGTDYLTLDPRSIYERVKIWKEKITHSIGHLPEKQDQ
jgi:5-methylthioadenosine/S-adenosylhomocysteine deaminase